MNLIENFYCSQYYEMKATGRDVQKGRVNATVLVASMLVLLLISTGMSIDYFSGGHPVRQFFSQEFVPGISGHTTGKILAFGSLALTGFLLNITYGSEKKYMAMTAKWDTLPEELLKGTRKKAMLTFGIVFVLFVIVMSLHFV